MLGKKKTLDIQFYKEAGSQADDLNIRHRGNDYEEYEIELKERQHRERINNEFYKFTKNVQELNGFEFDVPFREMEFTGVPNRSNVVLLPTKYCLVSLVETPVFVITLSEVDIVYFERVSQSLKNFDMTFIFKDLSKQPHRITAIPMEHLDMLKTWLDDNDILYGEGLYNIHWPKMLQKIKSDPKQFLDEGGWNFIQENDDSESSSESREKDSDYNMDEEEEDEDDSSDEEYEEEDVESESEGSGEGESALSEKGLSWEELEKKAIKSDKEHAKKYKDEDEKKGKKKGRK
jgi:nucleosome binding factor SPN SPT16 subunit